MNPCSHWHEYDKPSGRLYQYCSIVKKETFCCGDIKRCDFKKEWKVKNVKTITLAEWLKEGEKRFGKKVLDWKFVCPICNTVQSGQDLIDAGIKREDIDGVLGFSCIGRFTKDKGCDWTLGGLLTIHTCEVLLENGHKRPMFEWADSGSVPG